MYFEIEDEEDLKGALQAFDKEVIEKETDNRGRVTLGVEFANTKPRLAILKKDLNDNPGENE